MSIIRKYTYTDGTKSSGPKLNEEFDQVYASQNQNILDVASANTTANTAVATANAANNLALSVQTDNALKANLADVYTKAELDPFLRGGDTLIKYEVFTIINSNNGDGTFTYSDKNGNNIIGSLDENGYQIFALQNGSYELGQNRINATINDTLQRSAASEGLKEIDTTLIALTSPEGDGAEITIQYFERISLVGTGTIIQSISEPPTGFYWFKEV